MAVSLEMLGKFAVTAGSALMYVYTAELYPTVLRNTGTGACSVLSRVGSSVAPFLFKLSEETLCGNWYWFIGTIFFSFCMCWLLTSPSLFPGIYFYYLPYITLGALAVGSALSALFLPETFRKPLPQTIEQMPKRKGWVANERLSSVKTASASKLLFTSKRINDCVILCQQNKVPIQVK